MTPAIDSGGLPQSAFARLCLYRVTLGRDRFLGSIDPQTDADKACPALMFVSLLLVSLLYSKIG